MQKLQHLTPIIYHTIFQTFIVCSLTTGLVSIKPWHTLGNILAFTISVVRCSAKCSICKGKIKCINIKICISYLIVKSNKQTSLHCIIPVVIILLEQLCLLRRTVSLHMGLFSFDTPPSLTICLTIIRKHKHCKLSNGYRSE